MREAKIVDIKKKRNDLAYQIETLIQDFTDKTNYIIDKITVEYQHTGGLIPKDPIVRISIRLGIEESQDSGE
jgi:hypothetical protein